MDEFTGKVVLITGAGRGLGREVALAFASLGACVAANDISPLNVDETVQLIRQGGGVARDYVFDIAKRMPIEGMLSQVMEHFGRIDVLVNQASVKPDASILDMDEWEFHRTLDVNLAGPFFCLQQVGRVMRQIGGGAIVNIISIRWQNSAQKGRAAYLASQAGVAGLTRAAALELSQFDIRVNAVCDTGGEFGLIQPLKWESAELKQWITTHPGLRLGQHPNLVSLVLFLCSDAAASLTGQVLSL